MRRAEQIAGDDVQLFRGAIPKRTFLRLRVWLVNEVASESAQQGDSLFQDFVDLSCEACVNIVLGECFGVSGAFEMRCDGASQILEAAKRVDDFCGVVEAFQDQPSTEF